MRQYYIGGKRYVPENSTVLCSHAGIGEKSTLYRTGKGAFFLVEESDGGGTAARVVSRDEAFAFMDAHAAEIVVENYDAAFGTPEEA